MDFQRIVLCIFILILNILNHAVCNDHHVSRRSERGNSNDGYFIPLYGVILIALTFIIMMFIILFLSIINYRLRNKNKDEMTIPLHNRDIEKNEEQEVVSMKYVKLNSLNYNRNNYVVLNHNTSQLSVVDTDETDETDHPENSKETRPNRVHVLKTMNDPMQALFSEELKKKFATKKQLDNESQNLITLDVKTNSTPDKILRNNSETSEKDDESLKSKRNNNEGEDASLTSISEESTKSNNEDTTEESKNKNKETVEIKISEKHKDFVLKLIEELKNEDTEKLKVNSDETRKKFNFCLFKKTDNIGKSVSTSALNKSSSIADISEYDFLPPVPSKKNNKTNHDIYFTVPRKTSLRDYLHEGYDFPLATDRVSYVEPAYSNAKIPKSP